MGATLDVVGGQVGEESLGPIEIASPGEVFGDRGSFGSFAMGDGEPRALLVGTCLSEAVHRVKGMALSGTLVGLE